MELNWDYFVFEIRPPEDSTAGKLRVVEVYCPFPEDVAMHGAGASDSETVARRPLSGVERCVKMLCTPKLPKAAELSVFFKGMAKCHSYQITGRQALEDLIPLAETPVMRGVVASLWYRLGGEADGDASLTSAMEMFPNIFDEATVSVLKSGAHSGNMEAVLGSLVKTYARGSTLLKKIRNAMIYPAFVMCLMMGVMMALGFVVVPKMAAVYKSMNLDLPLATRLMMDAFDFLRLHWYLLLIPAGVFAWLAKDWKAFSRMAITERVAIRLPVLGPVLRGAVIVRSLRAMSLLLRSKVSTSTTFELVAKIADHHEYRGYFSRVGRRILEGMNVADAYLREQNTIPHDGELITANARLGEKVRDLPRLLDEYADERDDDVQMMVDVLPKMLDPIILIILSFGLGGMMMAIYYPYFGLLQKIIEQIN